MAEDVETAVAAIARIDAVPLILDIVCQTTGMGFAAVARVTEDRWIACSLQDKISFGLKPGGELNIETTICSEVREARHPVIIDHVVDDLQFCGHPAAKLYGFQSYISMPIIRADGAIFGTLCAIDPQPRPLNKPDTVAMFKAFAELIARHLDADDQLASSVAALDAERRNADLREQFIAVLGHDLRNPLASIDAGAQFLVRRPLDEKSLGVVKLMQGSVRRMNELIGSVLDFARGRLGGGLTLDGMSRDPLQPVLEQVVAELQATYPGQVIETDFRLAGSVACDGGRVAQLLSNLLANAVTHGAPGRPIRLEAAIQDRMFRLTVSNQGDPIPAAAMAQLFQPFYRNAVRPAQEGLGLGLYIASMIAKAHGGTLTVTSTEVQTSFTFCMQAG